MKILVVDDEKVLVKGIKFNLESEGYQVETGYDGEEAVELARSGNFDLIILDLMMPKIDGLQACMRIREFSNVPVIMLTARSEDTDKIIGFECGADDYITKPYNIPILLARINLLLRRGTSEQISIMEHNGIQFNLIAGTLTANGKEIELTKTELKIMYYLFIHTGEIVPRIDLVEYLWDNEIHIDDNTLSVNIMRIREKLRTLGAADFIQTKRGMGYKI